MADPTRPTMPTDYDRKRAEHLALRGRMLSGSWMDDLKRALDRHISPDRVRAWGIPEPSRNPFRSVVSQIGGALYREPPRVGGLPGAEALASVVSEAGVWSLMQRVSTDLIGLREVPVRVDWSERGGLLVRPLDPAMVVARALPESPDVPVAIEEMQLRANPKSGAAEWVWEVLDVTDLDRPQHAILSGDREADVTALYLPASDYAYRDADGKPFLPISWYHAERTGRLWDSWHGMEAVFGTLTVGVLSTFWVHGMKDGSFATVLLIGGKIVGLEVANPGTQQRTNVISVEPGAMVEVAPMEEGVQPSAIQLQPGFRPLEAIEAIQAFEAGVAEYAGVSPADILRTSADPRSGISLSISREGLRTAQARVEPQLRRGDAELLSITAKILNRAAGTAYPESGYTLAYPSLPMSADEIRAQREDVLAKMQAGLISKVDALLRLNPGLTREQATAELRRIQAENTLAGLSI